LLFELEPSESKSPANKPLALSDESLLAPEAEPLLEKRLPELFWRRLLATRLQAKKTRNKTKMIMAMIVMIVVAVIMGGSVIIFVRRC
jgi:hypothetical protein